MARVYLWVTVFVSVIISTASHVELKCLYAVNDSKNPRERDRKRDNKESKTQEQGKRGTTPIVPSDQACQ